MSLLGIDVGTTGCKAVVFSEEGTLISSAYAEYDFQSPTRGQAELNSEMVWQRIKETIARALLDSKGDPVKALSIASLGEAVVPVTRDRQILGPSLLSFDIRGAEYLDRLPAFQKSEHLYRINGNTLGNHYGLTKLLWLRDHRPEIYEKTFKFLLWGSFVAFMLGADPVVDYSLANRTLLFDLEGEEWSKELLQDAGLDLEKLPRAAPSGTVMGCVSTRLANELGVPTGTPITTGAHDQCSNAVGCGVIEEGQAMYGMGTYICIVPVYSSRPDPKLMVERGLNTEHHAVSGKYVSFVYNQGGSIVKWFRDTFTAVEHNEAKARGEDIYIRLFDELPDHPSRLMVLPHFSTMGPPDFISDSCGLVAGLYLDTSRGEILKGILEGNTFSLKECVDTLPGAGIEINSFRSVGGGSKSNGWIQISADILGKPFARPTITEGGALGAAIMAGAGTGVFSSLQEGIEAMVHIERTFEPDPRRQREYKNLFEKYTTLWPLVGGYLRELHRGH
jgi:xylulokinase